MEMEDRLIQLERRLLQLEDEREIQQVLHAYAHGLDYHDEAVFRDVWTVDAVFDRVSVCNHGLEDIMANYFHTHSYPPAAYHKHHIGVSRIMLDGDHACVHSYGFRLNCLRDGPVVFAFGRYRDDLVRCADGRWRIAKRVVDNEGMQPWDREDVAEFLAIDNLQAQVAAGTLQPGAHAAHLKQLHAGKDRD